MKNHQGRVRWLKESFAKLSPDLMAVLDTITDKIATLFLNGKIPSWVTEDLYLLKIQPEDIKPSKVTLLELFSRPDKDFSDMRVVEEATYTVIRLDDKAANKGLVRDRMPEGTINLNPRLPGGQISTGSWIVAEVMDWTDGR